MAYAIRVHAYGGPEVLTWENVDVPAPGPGEAKIRHSHIGLNFIDAYHRSGLYKQPHLPFVLGTEGAGEVIEIGEGVTDVAVGDRVAYASVIGAYAEERLIPASRLVKLPAGIDSNTAAAMMLQGMTVQYLLRRTYRVGPETTMLLHAAAGGVGLIASQWGKHLGATIIGTAGSDEKVAMAKSAGCTHVIDTRREDFVERVKEITGGKGVDVVYDGVGKDTFPASLDCLKPFGLWVTVRQCVGAGAGLRDRHSAGEGLAFRDPPDAKSLHRDACRPAGDGTGAVRRGRAGPCEDRRQSDLCAEEHRRCASRSGSSQNHGIDRADTRSGRASQDGARQLIGTGKRGA